MKLLLAFILLVLVTLCNTETQAQCDNVESISDCPDWGCRGDSWLNKDKNRLDTPQAKQVKKVNFSYFARLASR